jgi:hypothetical protein
MGARIAITNNWNGFCRATKVDGEWFANEMLGVTYVVNEVDDHPRRFNEWKTKYQINSDIRACRDEKGGVIPVLGNVWKWISKPTDNSVVIGATAEEVTIPDKMIAA